MHEIVTILQRKRQKKYLIWEISCSDSLPRANVSCYSPLHSFSSIHPASQTSTKLKAIFVAAASISGMVGDGGVYAGQRPDHHIFIVFKYVFLPLLERLFACVFACFYWFRTILYSSNNQKLFLRIHIHTQHSGYFVLVN